MYHILDSHDTIEAFIKFPKFFLESKVYIFFKDQQKLPDNRGKRS